MQKLKILDLFSGLGGFSLGLERTGRYKTVAFCEIDKYCTLLLQKHWKGIKVYNDVKKITKEGFEADGIESPDIITGGFPCQPFSVAGKQKGTSDDRHLWPEMFRIIKAFKPRFVIGENVPGIVNIQDGVVFETVCTDLESQGYEVQPFNIPATAVGAPHQRKRIWIIGYNVSNTFGKLSDGCSSTTRNSKTKFKGVECNQSWNWNEVRSKTERCGEQVREKQNLQYTNNQRCKESDLSKKSKKSDFGNREYDSTRENKTWWQTQSELCGVPNGVSYELDKDRANRIKALGNSIVPQIVRELGLAIIEAENDR